MAKVRSVNEIMEERKRWGMSIHDFERVSLHKAILRFMKDLKDSRLDPFDQDLQIWVYRMAEVLENRCQNKQLLEEISKVLNRGCTYDTTHEDDSFHYH